jgi:hypothetical protein
MIEILLSVHVESSGVSVFWFQRSRVPGCSLSASERIGRRQRMQKIRRLAYPK